MSTRCRAVRIPMCVAAVSLALTPAVAHAQMDLDGTLYRSQCVGATGNPAGQVRGTGTLKLKAPGLGSYVQYPFDSSWHTEQRIGTYNGGYWRGVASLQLNYEATFAFCS